MFNSLQQQPADKILALMQVYKEDPRENKIDLGVGVYKDASGQTPIMQSIILLMRLNQRKNIKSQIPKKKKP